MSLLEVPAVVVRRSAEHLRDQQGLVALELRHVRFLEESDELVVGRDQLVEAIHDCLDGRPSADPLVVAHTVLLVPCIHGVPPKLRPPLTQVALPTNTPGPPQPGPPA